MSKIKNWALRKAIAVQTRDEEGQGLVEYGLIIALIALVVVVALTAVGTDVNGIFEEISTTLS
ncbi:MAG TPA: Flp family type IVb pilin [Tepidiformaceae bacterium]|nr:Flp family type IVb pilin [Tepidiformaceae bacterium]